MANKKQKIFLAMVGMVNVAFVLGFLISKGSLLQIVVIWMAMNMWYIFICYGGLNELK